ncbi:hypothetical protein UMM65_01220 [Aureibaculum sp. 2210JD6-5]|uniref:hypothetical protein n=1 Tax=Aureibaculum sp. 2210JD6-5 TaxID=3103957 RepID=UPI002AAE48CC|nr:hypothetical protein [Aureibaculum sp. 2210JD6-5]MDY7393851.1 hypothetical protein [Aureibaculum sp. 2210JD6-5]
MIITEGSKKRNTIFTIFLSILFITDSIATKSFLFENNLKELNKVEFTFGILGIIDMILIILLFYWKKWAFWGLLITSIITLIINLDLGYGAISLIGLLAIIIIYLLLQIKKDGIKGWENLE